MYCRILVIDCLSGEESRIKVSGFLFLRIMKEQSGYVPPRYIPLGQSDREESDLEKSILPISDESSTKNESVSDVPVPWSSGICACFDDLQSCMMTSTFWPLFFSS